MNDPNNNVVYSDIEAQKQSEETPLLPKGQLISEEFFLVFRYSKKPTKFLQISVLASKKWLKQKLKHFIILISNKGIF